MKRHLMKAIVLMAVGVALSMPDEADPHDESVKRAYGYTNWCGCTRMAYPRLVQNWRPPALSLPTNDLNIIVVDEGLEASRSFSVFRRDGRRYRELFGIDTEICSNTENAHGFVMGKFSYITTPIRYQQVTNDIGDVLFYYKCPGDCDFAVFARNNVFVSISSYMPSCSATNIAKQIDASILRASGVEP